MSMSERPQLYFKNASEDNVFVILKELFFNNKALIHCDLSYTGFSKDLV